MKTDKIIKEENGNSNTVTKVTNVKPISKESGDKPEPNKIKNVRSRNLVADPIRGDGCIGWMEYELNAGQHPKSIIKFQDSEFVPSMPYLPPEILKLPFGKGADCSAEELFLQIRSALVKVFIFPSELHLTLTALYILASWVFDDHDEICNILATGLPGSGKTAFLKACWSLGFNSFWASGSSTNAAVLRLIDSTRGMLVMDEAQQSESANDSASDFHRLLVEGNQKQGVILKCIEKGGKFEAQPYSLFNPKILGARSIPSDEAVSSRTLEVFLPQRQLAELRDVGIVSVGSDEWQHEASKIRNNLLRYRQARALNLKGMPGLEFVTEFLDDDFSPREAQVFGWLIKESPNRTVAGEIVQYLKERKAGVQKTRTASIEYQILMATFHLTKEQCELVGHKLTSGKVWVHDIIATLQRWGHARHSNKQIGKVLRDSGIETAHGRQGTYVKATRAEIEIVFERLGYPMPDLSHKSPASHANPKLEES